METNGNNSGFDLDSVFAYGTFGPKSDAGSTSAGDINMLNPFYNSNCQNNRNASYAPSTSGLLSPSLSRTSRSRSCFMGSRGTRGTVASQRNIMDEQEIRFLSISKPVVGYLTFVCCLLFANMTQMILLYNLLSADNDKKYILIYIIFPFLLFLFLKINDLNLCNTIVHLLHFGYVSTPKILNRNRQIIHCITFIGFPFLWILYLLIESDWIQSMQITTDKTFTESVKPEIIHSLLITIWTTIQFIQFLLCVITLLYCIQHNIQQQQPIKQTYTSALCKLKYSFSMTNPLNNCANNDGSQIMERYTTKIKLLENQLCTLQTDLMKAKHETIAANSALSTEYAEEIQEKNQDFRALLSEKELLQTELENKKSLLSMKKQQIKQQSFSLKSLQQIREENITTINELKRKFNTQKQEMQKMQILLQIERQNAQKAQQYFENFT